MAQVHGRGETNDVINYWAGLSVKRETEELRRFIFLFMLKMVPSLPRRGEGLKVNSSPSMGTQEDMLKACPGWGMY
jgi:hypothetical protein